ncbi:MAG: N-acetyltransferase [Planctomycetales bacterium]|nr:N-acetyltransferase [Planctomycetales bacterium]
MIHPTALVETENIGDSTHVWAYAHVMQGAQIGNQVNIGDHAFIEGGAIIGDRVTLKNRVCVWEGVTIEDDVFVGPCVTFTNDKNPRSPRMEKARARYATREGWLVTTLVRRGCSIGAAATLVPGIELGAFSMIGAGALVTKDVPPYALVCGSPAKRVADVCGCGQKLSGTFDQTTCPHCEETPADRLAVLQHYRRLGD